MKTKFDQAVEAGAEAEWNSLPGPRWKNLSEEQRTHRKAQFSAGLTAALDKLVPEKCDDRLFAECGKVFDKTNGTFNDGMRAAIDKAFQIIRSQSRQEPEQLRKPTRHDGESQAQKVLQSVVPDDMKARLSGEFHGARPASIIIDEMATPQPASDDEVENQWPDLFVETVAKAMYQVALDEGSAKAAWESAGNAKVRTHYRNAATAAIRAMRGKVWGIRSIPIDKRADPQHETWFDLTGADRYHTTDKAFCDSIVENQRELGMNSEWFKFEVREYREGGSAEEKPDAIERLLSTIHKHYPGVMQGEAWADIKDAISDVVVSAQATGQERARSA